jgi:pyruvate,water dikinase
MAGPISDPTRGGSEPDRVWTLTNVAEATPEVLSPLCWSVWGEGVEFGARQSMCDFGILPRSAVRQSGDPNELLTSCFFGRQAMNIDLTREIMAGVPGTSADEYERDMLGSTRADAKPVPNSRRRLPAILAKAPATLVRHGRQVRELHAGQVRWWQERVLAGPVDDPKVLLAESALRFRTAMRVHVRTRTMVTALRSQVLQVVPAEATGLSGALLSGYGNVAETALAEDLWQLGLKELSLDTFLSRHGFHGSSEGNLISRSWRENPKAVVALAAATTQRSESDRPRSRERQAIAAREAAEARLLARLTGARRISTRLLLRATGAQIRGMEYSKAAFLTAVDGCRAAARQLGRTWVEGGALDEVDDVFFFTRPELLSGLPADAREVVAFRRARREEYRAMSLPTVFTGVPEPVAADSGDEQTSGVVPGSPGGPGLVEGRVRVVLDPDHAEPLDDGEILVCRMTDPGWTPLFTLASALVIDIGSPTSHGAIIARELGLPCVIGTGTGTRRLHDGDLVRVDGDAGTVTVLERGEVKA